MGGCHGNPRVRLAGSASSARGPGRVLLLSTTAEFLLPASVRPRRPARGYPEDGARPAAVRAVPLPQRRRRRGRDAGDAEPAAAAAAVRRRVEAPPLHV